MVRRLITAALAAAVLYCAGCGLLQTNPQAPQVQAAKIAVHYGVGRYIGSRAPEKRAATIERIKAIVGDVQQLAAGETVTLAVLRAEVLERLPADLRPEDRLAINDLLDTVSSAIQQCAAGAPDTPCGPDVKLSPATRVALDTVAGWILEVANTYPTA